MNHSHDQPRSRHDGTVSQTVRETYTALKPLLVLVGPTAIGKSRVAVDVARFLNAEIVTADSTQVYRGMNVGTDTPSETERQGIPHRLINLVDPDEPFNAGEFCRHATREITRLHERGRLPFCRRRLRALRAGVVTWVMRDSSRRSFASSLT